MKKTVLSALVCVSMFVGWSDMKFNFFSQVKNQAWALWCTGKKKGVKKAYP